MQPTNIRHTNERFTITWSDGSVTEGAPRDLRLFCPCAACVNEVSGQRTLDPKTVPQDVHPVRVEQVGRYGISIFWSDGHATGIYSFDRLREWQTST